MSIKALGRCGAALLLALLAAGCSTSKPGSSEASSPTLASAPKSNECKSNRSKCLYQGKYEVNERDYAEQEAKRLNLAEIERLRRSFGK